MTENTNKIICFITPSGRSASDITQGLSELGDGSMEKGLSRIAKYFINESIISENKGVIKGVGIGSIGTMGVIGMGYLIKNNWSKIKSYILFQEKHQTEGDTIVKEIDKIEELQSKKGENNDTEIQS